MELDVAMVLDGVVFIFLLGCVALAFKDGFIMAALGFVPTVSALLAVRFFTPAVGKMLRGTVFFTTVQNSIGKSLKIDEVIGTAVDNSQTAFIEGMTLPRFLKDALLENNNSVVHNILDVQGIQEYITGYLANICINIISVLLVFVVVWLGAKLVLQALNLISELPVLSAFNRLMGAVVGLAKGVSLVWLIGIVLTFFQCSGKLTSFFAVLAQTQVASLLYENNILLYLILRIFT